MRAYMIIDGQWGSCGKGLVAGYLADKWCPDAVVCNFGPNAGHTFVNAAGRVFMTRQLPTAAVTTPHVKDIFIGPGSTIDPTILASEIKEFKKDLKGKQIYIHERAVVVLPEHRAQESRELQRISSTGKGAGAALAAKVMRVPGITAGEFFGLGGIHIPETVEVGKYAFHVLRQMAYQDGIESMKFLQIESAQGLELGVNSGSHYPFCTSRDITPAQVLSDCGVHYKDLGKIVTIMRTFPIRVGDQFNADGKQVGTSGPVFSDQKELQWSDIELAPKAEKTTVTGKIRRVFTWSDINMERMFRFIRPDYVFLNFVNYLDKEPSFESENTRALVDRINTCSGGRSYVKWLGTGPREDQILDVDRYNNDHIE